ncbi:Hsp20/alpha crystallin family protein [Desulfomonile tiedjei]|uniref:Molecular chaperone (Small heat shock protein) n=1 Tax=Desulfomonile tiedjei (strain ATCC 49306 / DSM 6799 / DCB-1) TaxID=706587 RepID=I4C510_DESTA|nr:Hsp20/alpha crystallin family protein [Desulfomonile tiedjei]AFM24651.1 molecular chaperone (small heat shock protein) [Desulfomonile tiedjei DSM 6799]
MFELAPWKRKEGETGSLPAPWVFRREFDDLIQRFFGDEPFSLGITSKTFSPAVNISENENEILVTAEIPGIEKNDLDISLSGDVLTIKGEKKAEHEEKTENMHRIERSYGSFSRSFALPCEVQEDKINASYKDGVLSLKLPKAENCKAKSIKIPLQ